MTADVAPTASAASSAASGASGPATRVKSAASTTSQRGYPNGHFGHLNAREEDALHSFRRVLEERGLTNTNEGSTSFDDPTLLRFLRARRWVVEDAYRQFKETEDWRVANSIDTLYRTIRLDAYEQSRRLYPQWTGRRDRRGTPLYVFEIRHLDSKTIAQYERQGNGSGSGGGGGDSKTPLSKARTDGRTPPGLLRLFALYENLTRFTQPLCTQLDDRPDADVPITMSTNIVDISGVGLKQFWNLKGHMQAASQLATAHYPETLDRIFILGAPLFFSTVWGWIKRWFDPITVSKIFVLTPSEARTKLEAFIDPRNIPRRYGGELDFGFGQEPAPDPAWEGVVRWEAGFETFPTGPLLWEDVDGGRSIACVAYGTEADGTSRRQKICTVPKNWSPDRGRVEDGVPEPPPPASQHAPSSTTATESSEATQPTEQTHPPPPPPPTTTTTSQPSEAHAVADDAANGDAFKAKKVQDGSADEASAALAPVVPTTVM